ncbi:type II secretion system minor pseudopilin GspJ [Kaarinaea lacus]
MKKYVRQAGFTLLELIVTLAIFGLLSVLAYGSLNTVLKGKQVTEEHATRLAQLQRTFLWLERDIEQTVNRSIRDEYGDSQMAITGVEVGRYQLELTRAGWRNPAGRARSNLQRVAYSIRDEKLVRSYWNVLDRAQDSQPLETELLDGVTRMELRFLSIQSNNEQEWADSWPNYALGGQPTGDPPQAVEVTLETEAEGRLTRLFRVPG